MPSKPLSYVGANHSCKFLDPPLSEDPVITKYLVNKNIRYNRGTKLNNKIYKPRKIVYRLAREQLHFKVSLCKPIGVVFGLPTTCIIMSFLLTASDRTKYSSYCGVKFTLRPSESIRYRRGFRCSGIRYSGVCFHIFYCNSAGLSNVVRYNGVFFIAGIVIEGCHCSYVQPQRVRFLSRFGHK